MKKRSLKNLKKSGLVNIIFKKSIGKIYGGVVKSDGVIYDTLNANVGNTIVDDLNGLIR